jgi:hypothetical protein
LVDDVRPQDERRVLARDDRRETTDEKGDDTTKTSDKTLEATKQTRDCDKAGREILTKLHQRKRVDERELTLLKSQPAYLRYALEASD